MAERNSTSLKIDKQTISSFLESGAENKFLIPEYQRPYAWTVDEVTTLFEDLVEFSEANDATDENNDKTYFIGSVVSFMNEETREREIIDGQQRITSLFLFLRAIYTNLDSVSNKNDTQKNLIRRISHTIWKKNKLTGNIDDYEKILISSNVVNEKENKVLKEILETGKADEKSSDAYSVNYLKFQELYETYSKNNPMGVYNLILTILDKTILLPISTEDEDTALTVFSTLNDRGLPLADADIFKAKIYKQLPLEKRKDFIDDWKSLSEEAEYLEESIQSLFYYYMFYLRAQLKDDKTTTPGIRKFYLDDNKQKLFDSEILGKLDKILNIWRVVRNSEAIENEPWSKNLDIRKVLDILTSYPNEFWKYPVITYYLANSNKDTFENDFLKFLRKLSSTLLMKYIETPTINAVKGEILKLNVSCLETLTPDFKFQFINEDNIKKQLKNPNGKIVRMLLKLIAYSNENQTTLLPNKWEIEHIFPQKWQPNYCLNKSDDEIKDKIEWIGNKVPFEKKLNIKASNEYFKKKKEYYSKSNVAVTKELSQKNQTDWYLEDIEQNSYQVVEMINKKLDEWKNDYAVSSTKYQATAEDLAKIAELKKKGLI